VEPVTRLVCCDLGQAADYTAIGVLEREPTRDVLRYANRPDLKTPYPAIADRLAELSATLGGCPIVMDATGVGRPVVDMTRERTRSLVVPVTITGGQHARQDELGYWHVPKRVLVAAAQVALQNQAIAIPRALPLASVIEGEMRSFRMRHSQAGNVQFEAWRAGEHDDLVLMLAMGLWYSSRLVRPLPTDPRSVAQRQADDVRSAVMRRVREARRRV
jgi:hypothetical protein